MDLSDNYNTTQKQGLVMCKFDGWTRDGIW